MGNATPSRAVVFGGGGVAGIAWELGVIAGLREAGIDLDEADTVLGTSAGSVAGTALRLGIVAESVEEQLTSETSPTEITVPIPAVESRLLDAFAAAVEGAPTELEARARIGHLGRTSPAAVSGPDNLPVMQARFPAGVWPSRRLLITAVDVADGEFRVFDGSGPEDLPHALAASCSIPGVFKPVPIGGRTYVDGGVRSSTNSDVVAGHDRVLIVACGPEAPSSPTGPTLTESVAALRRDSDVVVLTADEDSVRAFGSDSLAATSRRPSALAGMAQARGAAERIAEFWRAS